MREDFYEIMDDIDADQFYDDNIIYDEKGRKSYQKKKTFELEVNGLPVLATFHTHVSCYEGGRYHYDMFTEINDKLDIYGLTDELIGPNNKVIDIETYNKRMLLMNAFEHYFYSNDHLRELAERLPKNKDGSLKKVTTYIVASGVFEQEFEAMDMSEYLDFEKITFGLYKCGINVLCVKVTGPNSFKFCNVYRKMNRDEVVKKYLCAYVPKYFDELGLEKYLKK